MFTVEWPLACRSDKLLGSEKRFKCRSTSIVVNGSTQFKAWNQSKLRRLDRMDSIGKSNHGNASEILVCRCVYIHARVRTLCLSICEAMNCQHMALSVRALYLVLSRITYTSIMLRIRCKNATLIHSCSTHPSIHTSLIAVRNVLREGLRRDRSL